MEGFSEGYDFFSGNAGSTYAAFEGADYVGSVVKEIEDLNSKINDMSGFKTAIDQLKGDAAEFWHSGTFNINAAVKGSENRTFVERSHDFASPDITGNFDHTFGLKYYKTSAESAKQQAKSVFERYSEYKARGGVDDLGKFLADRGYTEANVMSDPIYAGQIRIIPTDQINDAVRWLEKKIAKESMIRPEGVERYRETLALLQDKIKDSKGVESVPLSNKEAAELARLGKEGGFDPVEWGLTTEDLIEYKYVLQQAFKSGVTAATISIVLKVAPEIIKVIQFLIKTGELDLKQFQKIGFAALSGGAEGFIRGSVSAAITTACKAGLWGEALKSVNPAVIGVITVITMNTIKNAYEVTIGRKSKRELANELVKEMFVSSCSLLLGGVVQGIMVELPVVGFMLGSFVGSFVGSFAYSAGYKAVLSFCVDTGFTMFGLVEQDYKLPEDVIKEIGIEVFDYDKFKYPTFEYRKFEAPKFQHDRFRPDSIDIVFLSRGIIGVHQIGYI